MCAALLERCPQEVEAGESGQRHPWFYSQFEIGLGYMRPFLKNKHTKDIEIAGGNVSSYFVFPF